MSHGEGEKNKRKEEEVSIKKSREKNKRKKKIRKKKIKSRKVMRFIIYVCFLLESMEKMGFNNKWISLMMQCISTISYFVLINRVILGSIILTRGLQ